MKDRLSKTDAQKQINSFFNKNKFSPEEVRKIKRIAMKFNIKLQEHRKKFCKKCLYQLKGKTRIKKTHKTIECENCGHLNRVRIISDYKSL